MIDSGLSTDHRRPRTPSHPRKSAPDHRDFLGTPASHPRKSAPDHRDFLGTPASRGPASPTPRNVRFRGDPGSAVLAHPLTNGIAPVLGAGPRSAAPGHRISPHQSESII